MLISKLDPILAELAEHNLGFVTSRQLISVGITPAQIARALEQGVLIDRSAGTLPYPAGMYRHSTAPTMDIAREWLTLAWLSLEPATPAVERAIPQSGVFSHETAARLHGLQLSSTCEITFPSDRRRPMGGAVAEVCDVRIRTKPIERSECERIDGLPVTNLVRTVSDLILDSSLDARKLGNTLLLILERRLLSEDVLSRSVARPGSLKFKIPEAEVLPTLVRKARQESSL